MARIDATVIKETKYVAGVVTVLSVVMQAVFLIIGKWDYTVLLGNLLSGIAGVLNFLLMGITVQKAVLKDVKDAKSAMKVSQTYRTLFLAVVLIIGFTVPCFNKWATLIAILFPRVAVGLRAVIKK